MFSSQFRRFASFSCKLVVKYRGDHEVILKNIGETCVKLCPIKSSGEIPILHSNEIIFYKSKIFSHYLSPGKEVKISSVNLKIHSYPKNKNSSYNEPWNETFRRVFSGMKFPIYLKDGSDGYEGIKYIEINLIDLSQVKVK